MRLFLASDHGGFALKEKLIGHLRQWKGPDGEPLEVIDCGAFAFDPDDDFPGFVAKAARGISADPEGSWAVVLGRSGQGEAMLANRFPRVRCALWYGGPIGIVRTAREHNDANALALDGDETAPEDALAAIRLFLDTPASENPRYRRRIEQAEEISRTS